MEELLLNEDVDGYEIVGHRAHARHHMLPFDKEALLRGLVASTTLMDHHKVKSPVVGPMFLHLCKW